MTVSTQSSQAVFLGNSSTSSFGFSFNNGVPFNSNVSLASYTVIYTAANGAQTTLDPSVYTLSFNAAVTGTLWGLGGSLVYPTAGSPIAAGTSLTLNRVFPLQQLTSISNQGDFAPQNIEAMGDIEEMQLQQIAARTGLFRGTWATGVAYNFSDVVLDGSNGANTGNYYACAIPNTSGTWSTDLAAGDWSLVVNVQIIAGYATSAASSATAAASSATSATSSATSAASSATSASTSATTATTQASNASTSATNASTSATNAATSATAAASSATSASSSATSATSSASTATTQASNASTSATNAATSATNAATSATAAAVSAVSAGSTFNSTSTTSNTIGTGTFTFTTQANKNYQMGQPIIAASAANGSNYIHGYVNSYSGTTLIITETDNSGSGAHSDWNIAVTGTQGPSGGGTGTVTTASVATANGFAGTVANPTTTPAITLTTSVTGVLKGNGTAISAATAGTDYLTVLSGGVTTSGNVATVVTNANLTGDVTSSGNATTIKTSVALAGSPTTTTQSALDNSTKVATTAYVDRNPISAMVLLSTQTISSSTASVSVTSGINSTYSHYRWEITNLVPVSNAVDALITVQQGGGFVAGTGYNTEGEYTTGGDVAAGFGAGVAYFYGTPNNSALKTAFPSTIIFEFFQPSLALPLNTIISGIAGTESGNGVISWFAGGALNTSAATTGIKLVMSSGNIATCQANLYGIT